LPQCLQDHVTGLHVGAEALPCNWKTKNRGKHAKLKNEGKRVIRPQNRGSCPITKGHSPMRTIQIADKGRNRHMVIRRGWWTKIEVKNILLKGNFLSL
jgi:hypothetical protein